MSRLYTRREVLELAVATGLVSLPGTLPAAQLLTPRQTEGPFYPLRLPLDSDNDLVVVDGASGRAYLV